MMTDLTGQSFAQPELLFAVDLQVIPVALDCHQSGQWLAVGAASGEVFVYSADLNREVTRWTAHKTGLTALHWHPAAKMLATGGQDGFVRTWLFDEHDGMGKLFELKATQFCIEHLVWRSDGKQLAIASGKDIRIYSEHGELQGAFHFPYSAISALSWRRQGVQLAAAGNGGVMIYNVLDPNLKPRKLYSKGLLLSLEWSPDGQTVAAGCQDNTVHCWRLKDGNEAVLPGYENKPKQLAWSNNSRYLASTGARDLMIWAFNGKSPEGRAPITHLFHRKPVTAIAFAPQGQWLAAGCKEGKLSIWQKAAGENPSYTLQGKSSIERLVWMSTGASLKLAAITNSGILGVWRILNKQSAE